MEYVIALGLVKSLVSSSHNENCFLHIVADCGICGMDVVYSSEQAVLIRAPHVRDL